MDAIVMSNGLEAYVTDLKKDTSADGNSLYWKGTSYYIMSNNGQSAAKEDKFYKGACFWPDSSEIVWMR